MRISDWSSDVCSSDLGASAPRPAPGCGRNARTSRYPSRRVVFARTRISTRDTAAPKCRARRAPARSEEHTSELQSLMRISYAVFCLKKKNKNMNTNKLNHTTYETELQ